MRFVLNIFKTFFYYSIPIFIIIIIIICICIDGPCPKEVETTSCIQIRKIIILNYTVKNLKIFMTLLQVIEVVKKQSSMYYRS